MTGSNKTLNFDEDVKLRLAKRELKEIKRLVRVSTDVDNCPKYDSESHFIRCSILRLIRLERENNATRLFNKKRKVKT